MSIEVSIIDYDGPMKFHVYTIVNDENSYQLCIKRLDSETEGWTENIKVAVNYQFLGITSTIEIGSSELPEKQLNVITQFIIP